MYPEPTTSNQYLRDHVALLCDSFKRWTGDDLADPAMDATARARHIFHAPFVVASHNTEPDPVLNYGNLQALQLWEMTWQAFTRTPSRLTAEPLERAERQRLLARVDEQGFVDDYRGIRISRTGRRFLIRQATVWNIVDDHDRYHGQAVCFDHWEMI